MDPKKEAFVVYSAAFSIMLKIHQDCKVQIVILIIDKALITILAEYSDFADHFFKKSATILPKHTEIYTYAIDLEKSKQPLYGLIYSLRPMELKTLKSYIKIN